MCRAPILLAPLGGLVCNLQMSVCVLHALIPHLVDVAFEIIFLCAAALLDNPVHFIQLRGVVPWDSNELLVCVENDTHLLFLPKERCSKRHIRVVSYIL